MVVPLLLNTFLGKIDMQLIVVSKYLNTHYRWARKDTVDWLKSIIAGNMSYKDFSAKVQSMDSSPFCGCVWTADFVAYRCRTCATSPCMSLCAGKSYINQYTTCC